MSSQIRFEPDGVEGLVASGTTLAAAAERLGVRVALPCGGQGECDGCMVTVVAGSLADLTEAERHRLSAKQFEAGERLACQARVGVEDCVVRVPPTVEGAATDAPPHDDARERIRDAFASMPTGEQVSTVIDLQLKVAGDIITSLLETPLRLGEQLMNSILGPPAVPPTEPPADAEDTHGQGGDSHEQF